MFLPINPMTPAPSTLDVSGVPASTRPCFGLPTAPHGSSTLTDERSSGVPGARSMSRPNPESSTEHRPLDRACRMTSSISRPRCLMPAPSWPSLDGWFAGEATILGCWAEGSTVRWRTQGSSQDWSTSTPSQPSPTSPGACHGQAPSCGAVHRSPGRASSRPQPHACFPLRPTPSDSRPGRLIRDGAIRPPTGRSSPSVATTRAPQVSMGMPRWTCPLASGACRLRSPAMSIFFFFVVAWLDVLLVSCTAP